MLHIPGETSIGLTFKNWKFGVELMLPDTILGDFSFVGAQLTMYIEADLMACLKRTPAQWTVAISSFSAQMAAVTAAAVGTVGAGAVAYAKPILGLLGLTQLPFGGTFKGGFGVKIAGVNVKWRLELAIQVIVSLESGVDGGIQGIVFSALFPCFCSDSADRIDIHH